MALTVTERSVVWGGGPASKEPKNLVAATVLFDSSYPTGGEAISVADFPSLGSLDEIIVGSSNVATKNAVWDKANSKLKLVIEDGTSGVEAEAGSTSDQSAVTVTVMAIGTSGSLA